MVNLIKIISDLNIPWRILKKRRELDAKRRIELNNLFDMMVEYKPSYINGRLQHPTLEQFRNRIEELNKGYWNVKFYFTLLQQYKTDKLKCRI